LHHPATQRNIETLQQAGNKIITVNKGELASGLFGEGRMEEPEAIVRFITEHYCRKNALTGRKALVTAGPTYEVIDPVRFIGNHSSGKMGIAIAESLYEQGAEVHLVLGPVSVRPAYGGIHVVNATSAAEMYTASNELFPTVDIAVMAAAVADYTSEQVSPVKIKKSAADLRLSLAKTKDILKSLGNVKQEHQLLVGFALETNNEEENAMKKLTEKNADIVVLNSLRDADAGFGKDTNKVTIFDREGTRYAYEAKSKQAVARDIVELIIQKIHAKA